MRSDIRLDVRGISRLKTLCLGSECKKRGFLEGGFRKDVHISWLWRFECQTYCWDQQFWVSCVSLGMTLDSAETPFPKTPFSWFLICCFSVPEKTVHWGEVGETAHEGRKTAHPGRESPIKATVLVGVSVSCLSGCFRAHPAWWKTAPQKRSTKRSTVVS